MTKTKLKITGLILALMMVITTLGVFGITVFAAEGDAPCTCSVKCADDNMDSGCAACAADHTACTAKEQVLINKVYVTDWTQMKIDGGIAELDEESETQSATDTSGYTGASIIDGQLVGSMEYPINMGVFITGGSAIEYNAVNAHWIHNGTEWYPNDNTLYEGTDSAQQIYAYYPYVAGATGTVTVDAANQIDYLCAAATDIVSADTNLTMTHALAKLVLNPTLGTELEGDSIAKVYVKEMYSTGTWIISDNTWSDLADTPSAVFTMTNYEVLVIPIKCEFLTITITMESGRVFKAVIDLEKMGNELCPGTEYIIDLQIGCNHEYSYTVNDDGTHTGTCSACGNTVTEAHSTEKDENKATCQKQAVCDLCGTEHGTKDPANHDTEIKYDNGFCEKGCYEPATLVTAENYESLGLTSDFVGYYAIGNAGQLFWFSETVNSGDNAINAVLTADIDMDIRDGWNPIGVQNEAVSPNVKIPYAGTFDGQNHIISNLYVYVGDGREAGLFGRVSGGTLKNFGVVNATVISDSVEGNGYRAGIIAGEIHNSTVENVFSAGRLSIITSHQQEGGIAGECADSILKNCFTTYGSLTDSTAALPTTVENCYYMALEPNADSCGTNKPQAAFEYGELAYLLGSAYGMGAKGYPVLGATTVTESEGFVFVGQSLNLGGDLSMKYYVAAYGEGVSADTLKMQFIHNGVITTVKGVVDENGYYVFTFEGINPQCMGDAIDATLLLNSEVKASKKGYSVEQNLLNLLAEYPGDEALKALVNDILAYGNAAGAYKQHETMINKDYVGSDRVIPDVTVAPSDYFTGYTVVFGQMNFIKIKVTLAEGNTLYLGETNITSAVVDGVYTTAGIAATDFDKVFTCTVKNGDTVLATYEVSVNGYISAKKNDASIGNLVKALYNYGVSAEVYSHALTGEGEHYIDELGDCLCGYQATKINLYALSETYVINDSDYYFFTGTGSYGIKVESGNPTIVLNNASITLTDGDYYSGSPVNGIHISSAGGTTEILVMGENSITAQAGAGIFVAEGGTVKITGNSREDVLTATGANGGSGIGGYTYIDDNYDLFAINCGNITIDNVTVYAHGTKSDMGDCAPGIGSAGKAASGTITINTAVVYAYGADSDYDYIGAAAIGTGFPYVGAPTSIPTVIVNNSSVHTYRSNPYSDYIGWAGDEYESTDATGSINCGDGGSVTNSTIYCYTVYDDTTDKVVTYDADGNATEN